MIKLDERKFSVCIAARDTRYYKHLDAKKNHEGVCGEHKALEEAQRLANTLGKKITVLTSRFNVHPDKGEPTHA